MFFIFYANHSIQYHLRKLIGMVCLPAYSWHSLYSTITVPHVKISSVPITNEQHEEEKRKRIGKQWISVRCECEKTLNQTADVRNLDVYSVKSRQDLLTKQTHFSSSFVFASPPISHYTRLDSTSPTIHVFFAEFMWIIWMFCCHLTQALLYAKLDNDN